MTRSVLLLTGCIFIPHLLSGQVSESPLRPDDGEEAEFFGWSTAILGDVAVIGASEDDDNGPSSGSAYIFMRSGHRWVQHQKLLPADVSSYDTFGNAVAISDSFAVIGAQLDDDVASDAGAVYLFRREGDMWLEAEKLTASDGAALDHFGSSVAIAGDLLCIGCSLDDDNGENSGSAYVFHRTVSGWMEEAKLLASDGSIDDRFEEVSISDSTILVGAWGDQDQGDLTGSAYVFVRTETGWIQQAKLIANDQGAGDQFGIDVSLSGDRALIGAWANDDNGENSGSAYVFRRDNTVWSQEAKLLPDDGAEFDEFGISVSLRGDMALVGADVDDDRGENSGSAYLFRFDSVWSQFFKFTAGDGTDFDYFGISVALDSAGALIGAGGDDDNGADAGAAYVYEGFALEPETVTALLPEDGAVVEADTVLLTWSKSFDGVDRYRVEWATDSLFLSPAVDSTGTDTTYVVTNLQNGESVWWRVRAHNLAGWGPFSNPGSFAVVITGVELHDEQPVEFALSQNYPNPFNPVTVFSYSLPVGSKVTLSVYNLLGEMVATLVDGYQGAGWHQEVWDASADPSGVYWCRLEAAGKTQVRKLLLVR